MASGSKFKIFAVVIVLLGIVGFFGGVEILHYTSHPKFCAICHPKQHPGPNGEVWTWKQSKHAAADVSCLDCHAKPGVVNYIIRKVTASKDVYTQLLHSTEEIEKKLANPTPHAAPEESCNFCHTEEVNSKIRASRLMALPTHFLNFRKIDYVVNPDFMEKNSLEDIFKVNDINGYAFSHKNHIENYKLRCVNCHFEEVGHPDHRKNYGLMMKKVCFTCHEKEGGPSNNDCNVCHTVQDKIRKGKISDNITGAEDVMASLACTECHTSFDALPGEKSCIECHDGSEDYGKMFNDWKTSAKGKFEKLELIYKKAREKAFSKPKFKEQFKKSENVYQLLKADKSNGIHNSEFISNTLDKLEKDFKEIIDNE